MKCERIWIEKEREVYFDTYLLENSQELHKDIKRPVIVICPGGGYKNLSDREAEPVALKYNSAGFHAVVLRYGVDKHAVMPSPIQDLAKTIVHLHESSNEWFIDTNNIFVAGFSAGGHLAASLGVFHNDPEVLPEFQDGKFSIKPKGVILGYPVLDLKSTATSLDIGISGHPDYTDIEFDMLHPNIDPGEVFIRTEDKTVVNFEVAMNAYMFGGKATSTQLEKYSLQNQVDSDSSPAFIWHGGNDGLILPQNALKFSCALQENKVGYELHIYGTGDHGLALANDVTSNNPWEFVPEAQNWIDMSITWIKNQTRL
ncbi:alpha/beta hydrolase [Mollicutes bacterium LVI A0039]|nr:alpha/beta hydrolase [Mollicutes bacterium LVI A0039]